MGAVKVMFPISFPLSLPPSLTLRRSIYSSKIFASSRWVIKFGTAAGYLSMHLSFLPRFFVSYSILNLSKGSHKKQFLLSIVFFSMISNSHEFFFSFICMEIFSKLERDKNQFSFDLFILGEMRRESRNLT